MRRLDWNNITATSDGEYSTLPAGGYVAKIVDMIDNDSKEYVELIWDINEGEHKDHYSDDWGKEHPYAHHIFLSYKEKALGMLKGRLEAIRDSNSGFDPFAAWDAGRLDMFRGRLLGINLQEEEYEKRDGGVGTRMNVCQVLSVDKVRNGEVKVKPKKTLDGTSQAKGSTTTSSSAYGETEDIPF